MNSHELKKSQIEELVKVVKKFSGMKNVIIAGDLNIDSTRGDYKTLKRILNYNGLTDLFDKESSFLNTQLKMIIE